MYKNMPTTPTSSTKATTVNTTPTSNIKNNSLFSQKTNTNNQQSTAIEIDHPQHTKRNSAHEIEEISKKISEHAEAIYRTWKSRGLAPTELLEFYANAAETTTSNANAASAATTTATSKINKKKEALNDEVLVATNEFLATVANAAKVDTATTEGLQELVNSFVLKDKELRAGNNTTMTGKTATKKATATITPSTKAVKPVKTAILLKEEEATPMTPAKNVVLRKTIKTPSAPLTTTTPIVSNATTTLKTAKTAATTTNVTTANSNVNSAKHKIGNSTIQQQQQHLKTTTILPITAAATTTTTTTAAIATTITTTPKVREKRLEKSGNSTTTKVKQRNNNTTTTTTTSTKANTPNVDINLNLDLNLNLHINDVSSLSQFQNDNLLKIKELLQDSSVATTPTPTTTTTNVKSTITKSAKTPIGVEQPKKKLLSVGGGITVVGVNCDRIVESAELQGNTINHAAVGSVQTEQIDGKRSGNATSASTKTTKVTKTNSKLNRNQALQINQIDDADKTAASKSNNNNNNNNNNAMTKITSKQSKTLAPTTTSQSSITTTSAAAVAKESNGNSCDVSVISDSSRSSGKTRTKIATTASINAGAATTIVANSKETKEKLLKNSNNNNNNNNTNNKDISRAISDNKGEDQQNMALVRSSSTSSMPTGNAKMKVGRSNSLTNGTDKNLAARPFLTRGSVAERVLMFEKCPDVRNSFLNIKRPDPVDAPPKSLLKVKLHATPPVPQDQNSLQKEIRNTKSVYIPRFYFPHGKPQPQIAMERTLRNVLGAFDSFPNNQVTKDELPRILKLCGIPFYWRMPVMVFCQQGNSGLVERQRFVEFWKQMNVYCHEAASRFVYILSRGQRQRSYILPEDMAPMVQDVVDTHPGLAFLKEATEFHSRYVHTVIARIFYSVNRSWSGRISISELKKSDLLEIISLLEEEDDINQIMAFFSYEHFYVIYCKFWELDKDHDLLINQEDLARHSDHALSTRIVERIFSGCVTRGDNKREPEDEPKMSYTDFVWFLLSEEDKRTPTAIEYWFRCMDIDGDGVLSMYELEYFYEEQQQRMESIGIETLPFEDCLCQMLDMIKPQRRDCVTLGDLKRCKMTHVFFDTFFNLEKYLDHEQRDPFASQRDEYISDWDRFAAQEYELLITEENN